MARNRATAPYSGREEAPGSPCLAGLGLAEASGVENPIRLTAGRAVEGGERALAVRPRADAHAGIGRVVTGLFNLNIVCGPPHHLIGANLVISGIHFGCELAMP